jgi:AraC-like DNA-binding protein
MSDQRPRPWHRNSVFGDGLRRPLDRERRAQYRFLLREHSRHGRLSPMGEWVGLALLKRLGIDGQCDPSHETLAQDAGCSARTVRRATAILLSVGLLQWQTRLIRTDWRAEQTSNAYELIPSAASLRRTEWP